MKLNLLDSAENDINRSSSSLKSLARSEMGNAGLIRDQRYRTDPDTRMPMPD